jgi:hypothetical protein
LWWDLIVSVLVSISLQARFLGFFTALIPRNLLYNSGA